MRLILWSGAYLGDKGITSGRLDAEHLLADVLGVERLQLYLQFDRPLTAQELADFKVFLKRRARREPLQYILGRTAFRELDLLTDRRALIPRPETEGLVELVLEVVGAGPDLVALDVGTGTGAIALSLALEGPFRHVVATDASSEALSLARANTERADLSGRVELREGATWDPVLPGERFDVVVSNPPYVTLAEMATLEPEVGDWEPHEALTSGHFGLDLLSELVRGAQERLVEGGLLALELGAAQGAEVMAMAKEAGLERPELRRDLAGRDRYVVAWSPGGSARP